MNITDIIVTPDRRMHVKTTKIGTMGESGVIQFRFVLPPFIKDTSVELFRKELLFANEIGKCRKIMHGDTFTLTEDLTQGGWLEMQLKLTLGNCVWKTAPTVFEFYPALDIVPGIKCKSDIEGETTFKIPFVENLTRKRRYPPHIPKGKNIPVFKYGEMTLTLPFYSCYEITIENFRDCSYFGKEIIPDGKAYPPMPYFAENVNLKLYGYALPECKKITNFHFNKRNMIPDGREYLPSRYSVKNVNLNLFGYNPEIIDLTEEDLHMYIDPIGPEIIIIDEEE